MVTVFAGGPPEVDPLPDWDRESGAFSPGDDVVAARRQEDMLASTALDASTHHLSHWDWQYRNPTYDYNGPDRQVDLAEAIAADLESLVDRLQATTWVVPLGLVHPDHRATAAGWITLIRSRPDIEWLVYDDLPYSLEFPADLERAAADLQSRGFDLEPITSVGSASDESVKRRALHCYRSQCTALGDRVEQSIAAPERIRRLTQRRPA
jgi:LmbE family N-acetylglucosaminyl deacetylase